MHISQSSCGFKVVGQWFSEFVKRLWQPQGPRTVILVRVMFGILQPYASKMELKNKGNDQRGK